MTDEDPIENALALICDGEPLTRKAVSFVLEALASVVESNERERLLQLESRNPCTHCNAEYHRGWADGTQNGIKTERERLLGKAWKTPNKYVNDQWIAIPRKELEL